MVRRYLYNGRLIRAQLLDVNLTELNWQFEAFTLNEGNLRAPRRENPSIPPLLAQSKRDMRGSRGRLTFSSFFSSSRKAETPLTIVWKGCGKMGI